MATLADGPDVLVPEQCDPFMGFCWVTRFRLSRKGISYLGSFESKRTPRCIPSKRQPLKLTSVTGSRWKLRLGSLGFGLLVPGLLFGVAVAVSEDLRLLYIVGVILLFCGATWVGARSGRDWLSAFLLYLPLAGTFGFAALGSCRFYGQICCYGPSRRPLVCFCSLPG